MATLCCSTYYAHCLVTVRRGLPQRSNEQRDSCEESGLISLGGRPGTGREHDRSHDRRGGELLVALELSRDQRQKSSELLPGVSKSFDQINRRIGYRVKPSMIWSYEGGGHLGLTFAFANDGIAGVPGVLRIPVESEDGKVLKRG